MDGDLLPHGTREPKHAARREQTNRTRPTTRRRELLFGVVLAVVAAVAITWWATSAREPRPTLVTVPPGAASSASNPPDGAGAPGTLSPIVPPSGASDATRRTLIDTYDALHHAYAVTRSYQTIPLATLGQLLPTFTIEDGNASSTNARVVSMLRPAANRVVLAVRDDAGCAWLRDFGSGAQFVAHKQVVVTCSAALAPAAGWTTS